MLPVRARLDDGMFYSAWSQPKEIVSGDVYHVRVVYTGILAYLREHLADDRAGFVYIGEYLLRYAL